MVAGNHRVCVARGRVGLGRFATGITANRAWLLLVATAEPQWRHRAVGAALGLGRLSFSFTGLVIGSVVFSLPFAVQPIQHAFQAIGKRPFEVAATLRASPWKSFIAIALPLAKPGFLTATILSFAHTVGEFGVVLMIGGNIPGETRVVSTEIYGHVEAMAYTQAHWLAGTMVVFSFGVLLTLSWLNRHSGSQSALTLAPSSAAATDHERG